MTAKEFWDLVDQIEEATREFTELADDVSPDGNGDVELTSHEYSNMKRIAHNIFAPVLELINDDRRDV